jgi:hypothetical protein
MCGCLHSNGYICRKRVVETDGNRKYPGMCTCAQFCIQMDMCVVRERWRGLTEIDMFVRLEQGRECHFGSISCLRMHVCVCFNFSCVYVRMYVCMCVH